MKRIIALAVVLCLCMSLTGCNVLDYKKAMDHYEAGEYAEALALYQSLGDFADSAQMAQICSQKADYKKAEELLAAGDYRQALPLYEGLGMHMDSPAKAVACRYQIGLSCIGEENYEEALSWLEPLGSYEDSINQVSLAKWQWLHREVSAGLPLYRSGDGTVKLQANEDGTFSFHYEKEGYLLGVQYTNDFVMTFSRESAEGTYQAVYDSSSSGQIKEEASGTVNLAAFDASAKLSLDTFKQTVVDPEGQETVSTETQDSLMMQGMLAEVKSVLAQVIPKLLEQTGLPVTAQDLGFASLT